MHTQKVTLKTDATGTKHIPKFWLVAEGAEFKAFPLSVRKGEKQVVEIYQGPGRAPERFFSIKKSGGLIRGPEGAEASRSVSVY